MLADNNLQLNSSVSNYTAYEIAGMVMNQGKSCYGLYNDSYDCCNLEDLGQIKLFFLSHNLKKCKQF